MRVTIHVTSKDRHSELAMLFTSLRAQSFQDWDLVYVDDASGTPASNCQFLMAIINRLRIDGHKVRMVRNAISKGVCYARNKCIEMDDFGNELICRLDDDIILDTDYLASLRSGIIVGYDLVTGVIPLLAVPEWTRDNNFVGEVINEHVMLNDELVSRKDECSFTYLEDAIIPTHQFRTNAMYKKELQEDVIARWGMVYPDYLSPVGFREEGFFSVKALALDFKLAVVTGAVAYHMQTASGGCRYPDYNKFVQQDDFLFVKFLKKIHAEYGDVFAGEKK